MARPKQKRPVRNSASRFHSGRYAHIVGWGAEVPETVLTNSALEEMVDTSDEWIQERTGVKERRIADDKDSTSSLGLRAARKALARANVSPRDLDLIIVSTSTPQFLFPSTANLIQDRLGASRAGAFDLLAACTGFIYGLSLAASQIEAGAIQTALVIGAETLSRVVNWQDRSSCILFGDGAGAFVVQGKDEPGGIRCSVLHSDGSGADYLFARSGLRESWKGDFPPNGLEMQGREVFRFASRVMVQATEEVLEMSSLTLDDVDLIVPHQANLRIIQAAARGLKVPVDRFYINVEKYGNTSTASIPLAIVDAVDSGTLKSNSRIVLVGFGAGLTWGASLIEWEAMPTPGAALQDFLRESWYLLARMRSLFLRFRRLLESLLFQNGKRRNP
nr:ketoacyl-ACP synthase III [Anaerolineae bacterium]